jgi:glycosyltransferase involved in cell wall biosynthesis
MYEIMDSPIWHGGDRGTLYPELDLQEPWSEAFFNETLDEFRPELVHIQEFAGLPTSLLEILRRRRLPHVAVMHDYHPLCPTLKLWDSTGANCGRDEIGEECRRCCAHAPADGQEIARITADFNRAQVKRLLPKPLVRAIQALKRPHEGPGPAIPTARQGEPAEAVMYQSRRNINVRRFNEVDVLAPVSAREGELYRRCGVSAPIVPLRPGLRHIETLRPVAFDRVPERPRFASINGGASVQKGAAVIAGAMRALAGRDLLGRFEFVLLGSPEAKFREELARYPNVVFRPPFEPAALAGELAGVHVGVVASVWEEIYGLVVDEFMALGIPVIGTTMGAVAERIVEGRTGWTMAAPTAAALADRMEALIGHPQDVLAANRHLCDNFHPKTMSAYADDLDGLYRRLLTRRPGERLAC